MSGQHVDAGVRRTPALVKQITGSSETLGELPQRYAVLQPETTDIVPVMVVPLGEAPRELAHLVTARPDIPRLGDQLAARKQVVRQQRLEQRRIAVERRRTAKYAAQIEAEAINVAFAHPKTQTVHHPGHALWLIQSQRVTAAGIVHVVAVGGEPVIARVIDTAQRQRRPIGIQLGAVVEHHVEDHLNTGLMQRFHRIAKLAQRRRISAQAGITVIRRKGRKYVVAPVINQSEPLQTRFRTVLLHRQQLQRSDAEPLEIGNHHRVTERGEATAQHRWDFRMLQGQAAYMRFVDHRFTPGRGRRAVILPIVSFVNHHALGHQFGAVMLIRPVIAAMQIGIICNRSLYRARGGIQQQFVGVKTQPLRRIKRTMHPETVTLPRFTARQVAVPDITAARRQWQPNLLLLLVKQAQLHPRGSGGIEAKVDAVTVIARPERRGDAGRQLSHCASRSR